MLTEFPRHYQEKVDSTMDAILPFLGNKNAPTALYTFHQISGRGQYGNSWLSEKGKSVAYSLAIPKALISLDAELFNYHTALLLRDFLAKLTQEEVKIKWPNDLILRGKKIAGILIESRKVEGKEFYIIGVGINVNQNEPIGFSKASSIKVQTSKEFDIEPFAEDFHSYLSENILEFPTESLLLSRYNENLFRRNEIAVYEKNAKRQNGIILKADEKGRLHIDLEEDGLSVFYHKEIQMCY